MKILIERLGYMAKSPFMQGSLGRFRKAPLAAGLLSLLFLGPLSGLAAQTATGTGAFDMTGFPQWSKDLRRAEIIAFGSFPFSVFFVTTAMDLYRSYTHDWDPLYRPWPFKPAGAVAMTTDEHLTVLGAAAAASAFIALADHVLLRIKRRGAERAGAALPPGSPIIIRRPWPESEPSPGEEAGAAEGP
jgi:hypothetical protein